MPGAFISDLKKMREMSMSNFPREKNKYISEEIRIVNVDEVIREIEGGQGRDNNALQQAAEIFAKNVVGGRGLK